MDHYINKIKESQIILHPFPHLIINNFLEPDLYSSLVKKLYNKQNDMFKNTPRDHNRCTKVIYNANEFGDESFHIRNGNIELEKKYAEILIDPLFKTSVIEKFDTYVHLESKNVDKTFVQLQLDCFRGTYNYPIHTDVYPKFITFLLYLANDLEHKELGTNIYDHNKDGKQTIDYIPNRLVIFSPSRHYNPVKKQFITHHNMEGNTTHEYRRLCLQSWYLSFCAKYPKYFRSGKNTP